MHISPVHAQTEVVCQRRQRILGSNVFSVLSLILVSLFATSQSVSYTLANNRSQAPALPQQQTLPQQTITPPANGTDVVSIDSIVAALYDVISGPAGKRRDWDRMRSLFLPGARLIPTGRRQTGETGARTADVEGYIAASSPYMERQGFFEREIGRRTERFNSIAHVFSTYESRHKAEDVRPFDRGINSIQLFNDGKRWWIVTVFWEAERPGNAIPEKYLQRIKS